MPFCNGTSQYLYLIRSDKYTKIGIASSCDNRVNSLQTGNPHALFVEGYYKVGDGNWVESALHAIYKNQRVRGEWYDLSMADIKNIAKICEAYVKVPSSKKRIYLDSLVSSAKKKQKRRLRGKSSNAILSTLRRRSIIKEISDHGEAIIPYLAQEFGITEKALKNEISKIRAKKGI